VYNAKYIYECDLKQFFPSVYLSAINKKLKEYHVPKNIIDYLHEINKRTPELPKELKLDEHHVIKKQRTNIALQTGIGLGKEIPKPTFQHKTIDSMFHKSIMANTLLKNHPLKDLFEQTPKFIRTEDTLFQERFLDFVARKRQIEHNLRGVNQGTPTSPLLSTLVLKEFLRQKPNVKSVCYADDPIF
jgi:hypothetical protein